MTTPADQPDLIAWLRQQLDDDEREAAQTTWAVVFSNYEPAEVDSLHDSRADAEQCADELGDGWRVVEWTRPGDDARQRRALAEVDAKRRILDVYRAEVIDVSRVGERPEWVHGRVPVEAHTVLRLLALPYADRPGYREEWRP